MYLEQEQQKYQPRCFSKEKKKKKGKKEKKTNPNLNTRTTFSFLVFHPLLFIKTHTIPNPHNPILSVSLFLSPMSSQIHTPGKHEKEESSEFEVDSVLAGLRLISFGFDSFESEVASSLVLALRFGFEVSVWFL